MHIQKPGHFLLAKRDSQITYRLALSYSVLWFLFRLLKVPFHTFQVLVQLTDSNLNKTIAAKIPTASKVLMTLWLLENQESYCCVADRFGVRKSTLHFIVAEVVSVWA